MKWSFLSGLFVFLMVTTGIWASYDSPAPAIWVEAEGWYAQGGSGGDTLREGASGIRTTHPILAEPQGKFKAFVLYQFALSYDISQAQVLFRYANNKTNPIAMNVCLDGTVKGKILFPKTFGSGKKFMDYGFVSFSAGKLGSGQHELTIESMPPSSKGPEKIKSEAPEGLFIDGFFILPEGVSKPANPMEFFSWTSRAKHQKKLLEHKRIIPWTMNPWTAIENAPVLFPGKNDRAREFKFTGCVNDYLSIPLFLTSQASPVELYVALPKSNDFNNRIALRICGLFQARNYGIIFDPLFNREDIQKTGNLSPYLLNWEQIKEFPRLRFYPYQTHLVWLTVNTEDMKPGEYMLKVELKTKDDDIEIPIALKILPVVVPKNNPLLFYVFNWTGNDPQRIDDMLAHGINAFRTSPYPEGGKAVPSGHRYAMQHGARFFLYRFHAAWGLKYLTPERRKNARKDIEQILTSVRSLGLKRDQWAIQISDEPNARNADVVIDYARMIREADPKAPTWIDPGWGHLERDYPRERFFLKLMPYIDVWCPFVGHLSRKDLDVVGLLRQYKKKIWFYKNISLEAKKTSACYDWYRIAPLVAWYYQTDEAGIWNLAQFYGDPWDNFDRKLPDAAFVYKGPGERFIPGRVYESLRQGVQEYKRFYLLERLVDETWKSGNREHAASIYTRMRTAAQKIIEAPTQTLIDQEVEKITQAILKLQNVPGN